MSETGERTLYSVLKRYTPCNGAEQKIFDSATDIITRIDKEQRIVEIRAHFPEVIKKSDLYALENNVTVAYELRCFRLLPTYPTELFNTDCMRDVLRETGRVGAVVNGFFDDYDISANGDVITIGLPILHGGILLLDMADVKSVIENIIFQEFSIRKTVEIVQCSDYAAKLESYDQDSARRLKNEMSAAAAEAAAREIKTASETDEAKKAKNGDVTQLKKVTSLYDGAVISEFSSDGILNIGKVRLDISDPTVIEGNIFEIVDIIPIRNIDSPSRRIVTAGYVFQVAQREVRGGDKLAVNVGITDRDSSIFIKALFPFDEGMAFCEKIREGDAIIVRGSVKPDKFDGELNISYSDILRVKRLLREDNYPEKRVELHLHTNMSASDALIPSEEAVKTAARWGHPAVAITDHGNLQSFPTAMLAAKKLAKEKNINIKVLYGMEAYFVDDTARAVYGNSNFTFEDEFVVFDIETTGLSALNNNITEIGAVIVKNREVISEFNMLVNPGEHIPEAITELTGITDDMVKNEPDISVVLPKFFDFIGDRLLIAHNAGFDTSFIRRAADRLGLPFENPYLDTVAMSRFANPELKKHKLDNLADYYGLGDFNHHRASDDAKMLGEIFFCMTEKLKDEGIRTVQQMIDAMSERSDPLRLKTYHQIILVKNQAGLKNLYKLVSDSYLKYYRRVPRVPKTNLKEYRDGLILGSACEAGELFCAVLENKSENELKEIVEFYDYLEIQPICNNRFLVDSGKVADEEALRDLNRRIVELGEKYDRPVVATCDAHYMDNEDDIFRRILLSGKKFEDADKEAHLYYRTTEEMLNEFMYLGEDKAHEVVIDNPRKIADMVEIIQPIPDGFFPPHIDGAEEQLRENCYKLAREMYGDPLPTQVSERLEHELGPIINNGFAIMYIIARKLVENSEAKGYQVGSRGSVGSSFTATMAGITKVNPLPPHYRCTKCLHSEFIEDGSVGSGFDLPEKNCPNCGIPMYRDGHDIPFETFLGFYGDKTPDIDLNFSGDVQGDAHKFTEVLFGEGHAFRAGTIGTLASKTAYGYTAKYLEEKGISVNKAEMERLIAGCVGTKRTTGQHPGGIIVVPKEYEITDFSPVQHPADNPNSDIITTHFEFKYLHDTLLKLDILGHDIPTKYKRLEEYTHTNVLDVPMSDPKVYKLFTSPEPLGVTKDQLLGVETGTLGLPELSTRFVRGVLIESQPKTFTDMLQISGLTHGTGVWIGNADELIRDNICTISDVIGTRDDIMLYLIQRHDMDKGMAFKIMEDVRKGRGLKPEYEEAMREHGVPDWYIDSCKKIKYMFPKAHAAAYVIDAMRLGWYKIYYPLEFYAAFFTAAPDGFDSEIVMRGKNEVRHIMEDLSRPGAELSQKDKDIFDTLQLVNECYQRGFGFLPVSIQKSHASKFIPEDGKIRLPFSSLPGVGNAAAESIQVARDNGEIRYVDDIKKVKVSKSVIEILERNGAFKGMSQTNQVSMFDI